MTLIVAPDKADFPVLAAQEGLSYLEISRRTHASTTTVTRVAHWLRHGEDGYRLLRDRMKRRRATA